MTKNMKNQQSDRGQNCRDEVNQSGDSTQSRNKSSNKSGTNKESAKNTDHSYENGPEY